MIIRSGGQTGADQAGLRVAKALGLETGGWAPKGWMTESGPMPELGEIYGLKEHEYPGYPPRTIRNAREADVTLWFGDTDSPGFACTSKACWRFSKPFIINPNENIREWLRAEGMLVVNIAGNRESMNPGIGARIEAFLTQALG